MPLHICLGDILFIADWTFFFEESVLLVFCLQCFDCDVVTLSASFFPLGILERKALGNCIDFWSLLPFYEVHSLDNTVVVHELEFAMKRVLSGRVYIT